MEREQIEEEWRKNHLWVEESILYFIDRYDWRTPHWHRIIGDERGILANVRSDFQHIQIFLTKYGKMLVLDGYPQVASNDEHIYHEALAWPALLIHEAETLTVWILGGGDGALLQQVIRDRRVKRAVLVDIDPMVVQLTQKIMRDLWGNALHDPRVTILHTDAMEFLASTDGHADIIYSDLTDPTESSLATPLMSKKYFDRMYECLGDNGICVLQAGELAEGAFDGHNTARELIAGSFPDCGTLPSFQSYRFHVPSFSTMWSAIIARKRRALPKFCETTVCTELFAKRRPQKLRFLTPHTLAGMFALPPTIEQQLLPHITVVETDSSLI